MKRVLVLTGMENLALAVLRSLGGLGWRSAVAGAGDGALLRASRHCAAFHRVAADEADMARADGRVLESAARALREFGPDLVVPVDVAGARLAASLKPWFPGVPFFPFPEPAALDALDDKWAFYRFLLTQGLPTPETRRLEDAAAAAVVRAPVVIKPPADSGGRGVAVVRTPEELSARLKDAAFPLLAQELVEGEDVDLSFLADRGRVLAWAIQLRSVDGTIHYIEDERVLDIGRRLAAASSYTGLAHVDMRYDGPARSRVLVIECNPRFWGTFSYTLGLGADFLGLGLEMALGGRPEPMTGSPVGASPSLKAYLKNMLAGRNPPAASLAHIRQKLSDPVPELLKAGRRLLGLPQNGP